MRVFFFIAALLAAPSAFSAIVPDYCTIHIQRLLSMSESVAHYHVEYAAMVERIGKPENSVGNKFKQVVQRFHDIRFTLHDPLLEGHFLRSVLVWASSMEDLELAAKVFELSEYELHLFMARVAYFTHHYDRSLIEFPGSNAREGAIASLARFDISLNGGFYHGPPRPWPIKYDLKTGRVTFTPMPKETIAKMKQFGLNVSEEAVGGFHLNNGRYGAFYEHPVEELWAAKQIARQVTGETLLGYGDPWVRNFSRVLHVSQAGYFRRIEKAADYLYIRKVKGHESAYEFVVRELKAHKASNDVEVQKALLQLYMTATDLSILYPRTMVGQLEIVVPERGERMAAGYKRSPRATRDDPNLYSLLDGNDFPVYVEFGEDHRLPVYVRMIPKLP